MKKCFLYLSLLFCISIAALTFAWDINLLSYITSCYESRFTHNIYSSGKLVESKKAKTLIKLLNSVEVYQPLYNIKFANSNDSKLFAPKRDTSSIERANLVYNYLKQDIKNSKVTILDIGSSMGYMSMFFADRGANVVGIDTTLQNVEISNLVAQINNLKNIKFYNAAFDKDYVRSLSGKYDVVFLFSVVHHIINSHGLEYAQKLVCDLIHQVPLLFIELALAEETVDFTWKSALPNDHLKLFENCDCSVEKLAEFDTHLSPIKRPLYLVKKKNNS